MAVELWPMALHEALQKAIDRIDLTADEASDALRELVDGDADPVLLAGLLVALRMKGETADEVAGFARVMREQSTPVRSKASGLVDTCGTGGDGTGTVNISTAAALVVAGAGLPVAKHGNRSITSDCGSSDVLDALGVHIDLDAAGVQRCIDEAGMGFMFAPNFHPAMAKIMPIRRALGVRTLFNVLGPLTNPARPSFQLVGVGEPALAEVVAGAFAELGIERAMVVHGADGADELTLSGSNLVLHVRDGAVERDTLSATDVGLASAPLDALTGGTPSANAERIHEILAGAPGPLRDVVVLNAGAALMVAGAADTIAEGVALAAKTIDSGEAAKALERLVAVSNG